MNERAWTPPGLRGFESWIDDRAPGTVAFFALVSILALGVLDYLSGPNIAFSPFYLLPLSIVAWKVGTRRAIGLAVLAALTWLFADLAAGADYSNPVVPIWNTIARFSVFVLVIGLLATLRHSLETQSHLARVDPLTEVCNPRSFMSEAEEAVRACNREGRPVTLVYLDLDDFKKINDTLGHSGGDDVLQAVASALTQSTRTSDLVGRLGGDEFAVVLSGTGSSAAVAVMDDMLERVRSNLSSVSLPVTFSAGAVTLLVAPKTLDEAISAADALMYEVKRSGKGTYRHVTRGAEVPGAVADVTEPRSQVA